MHILWSGYVRIELGFSGLRRWRCSFLRITGASRTQYTSIWKYVLNTAYELNTHKCGFQFVLWIHFRIKYQLNAAIYTNTNRKNDRWWHRWDSIIGNNSLTSNVILCTYDIIVTWCYNPVILYKLWYVYDIRYNMVMILCRLWYDMSWWYDYTSLWQIISSCKEIKYVHQYQMTVISYRLQ